MIGSLGGVVSPMKGSLGGVVLPMEGHLGGLVFGMADGSAWLLRRGLLRMLLGVRLALVAEEGLEESRTHFGRIR